jgi:hypothetical protein
MTTVAKPERHVRFNLTESQEQRATENDAAEAAREAARQAARQEDAKVTEWRNRTVQQITPFSPKDLNPLFFEDKTKYFDRPSVKAALFRTAAITLIVFYTLITIAAVVATGLFAPPLALPLVALSTLALIFPVIQGYEKAMAAADRHQLRADDLRGISNELKALNKLDDNAFRAQYGHLFTLDRVDNDEMKKMLAEKGIAFYKPIIARLNFWEKKAQILEKKLDDLKTQYHKDEKTIAESKTNDDIKRQRLNKEGQLYLNTRHQLQQDLAEAKMCAAFIHSILLAPQTLKTKNISDVFSLNKQSFLNQHLANALYFNKKMREQAQSPSNDPHPEEVFETSPYYLHLKNKAETKVTLEGVIDLRSDFQLPYLLIQTANQG